MQTVCRRCGLTYFPEIDIGLHLCLVHTQKARLDGVYPCCGWRVNITALKGGWSVLSTWADSHGRNAMGCTPADHDIDLDARSPLAQLSFVQSWSDVGRAVKREAIARRITGLDSFAVNVFHDLYAAALADAHTRAETIFRAMLAQAVIDPAFYEQHLRNVTIAPAAAAALRDFTLHTLTAIVSDDSFFVGNVLTLAAQERLRAILESGQRAASWSALLPVIAAFWRETRSVRAVFEYAQAAASAWTTSAAAVLDDAFLSLYVVRRVAVRQDLRVLTSSRTLAWRLGMGDPTEEPEVVENAA